MNVEEARIVAHVSGDGWLTKYQEKNALHIVHGKRYHQKRIRYVIGYCNTCEELLNKFEKDMLNKFNLKPKRVKAKYDIRFKSKHVFERLLELGAGKSQSWFIGKEVLNSDDKVKIEWLRAFFDDEGYVNKNYLCLGIVNKEGIIQIKNLLKELDIESKLYGPYIPKNPNYSNKYVISIKNDTPRPKGRGIQL